MFVISCVRKKKSGNRNFNNDSGRNCCLAWLRERRSGGLLSTPTADPFVAEEAVARKAGPRAVSAHVGQVCVYGGGSSLSFPPLSSVFEGVSPVLFKLWSSLVDCVAPGVSVSGHVRPLQALYVSHIERLLEAVFVAFLKCPSVTIASGEFAIKTTLGRRWSSILDTWPAHWSLYFSRMASMLGTSACSRTSTFVMNSF